MPERRLSRLLKAKLLRRSSTPAVPKAGNGADPRAHPNSTSRTSCAPHLFDSASDKSPYSVVSSAAGHSSDEIGPGPGPDQHDPHEGETHKPGPRVEPKPPTGSPRPKDQLQHRHASEHSACTPPPTDPNLSSQHTPLSEESPSPFESPLPTPQHSDDTSFKSALVNVRGPTPVDNQLTPILDTVVEKITDDRRPSSTFFPASSTKRPSIAIRRQSLLPASHQHLISGLLEQSLFSFTGDQGSRRVPEAAAEMVHRRIWVKRPGGSATLVPCLEDAVVDELRDQVIMKYANSLGRSFDSPDIVIRISAREGSNRQQTPERLLSPEEVLSSVLDTYYPGGQTVEEALLIDAPTRRTPKPSPRHSIYHHHHSEPGEHGDYFPLMPVNPKGPTPPAHPSSSGAANAPSISILTTGVAPALPSPGSRGTRHHRRPPLTRHTTNSPVILGQPPWEAGISPHSQPPPTAPAQPTPPAVGPESPQAKSHTPPAPVASPRTLRKSKVTSSPGAVFGGLIDGTVPPINVLIVEDNIINQKLLEAFMKRLSVRWKCAANGEEAVRKWRQGGFHLVLMDIQLPVMNGLDATKEIRRLERLNGIGVFSKTASGRSSASSTTASPLEKRPGLQRSVSEDDTLTDLSLFRSPVIIVALTASSLQSDRHEALAAGCNDFLTKPVGFPWLSQKVTEWGCMQALIDFDGWRKWRGFQDSPRSSSPNFDGAASPMQMGSHSEAQSKQGPASPSIPRTNSKSKASRHKRPRLPDAAEVMREDSWGSGSGDTVDSPTSLETTPGDIDIQPPDDVAHSAPNAQ
ncbi:uncharacterized protein N7482_002571 [Penicillium canariense]|uniref:Response regulatory domain-containing protein n=1 Tax=Penicillium canariense TaxID=189055 RepID=A0A9W9IFM5_9EURO|nr:uncharacterized protein N7482_002571 [Penicillium canariense]KAJ5176694.1 hypothetical protein N7482_002571 [Penicillium canariense]